MPVRRSKRLSPTGCGDGMIKQDIVREATRLTRAGQLVEATALLQRMLRGESAPDATWRSGALIIDAKANPIEETDSPQLAGSTSSQPRMLRALLDRAKEHSGIGLQGVLNRTPLSMPDIVPAGARFIEGAYSNPAGSRAYRLFIPSRYQGQPLPLVVMLHGCSQSPDDFAAGTRMNFVAEEQKCFVVYPAQHSKANQAKCWNWFRTADQQRDRGEPSLIAGITRQIMHDYSVDQRRVYVGGLSAGAAAAAIMGATYKDLYAAVGIHSGLACGAATDIPSAFAAMRQGGSPGSVISGDEPSVPTIVFHGDRDTTVHPNNGDQILKSMRTRRTQEKVHRGQVAGGRAYTRTIHSDANGRAMLEHWNVHGAGHAWSGGSPAGSYTDPRGPDATREMLRFFLDHSLPSPPVA
ncbi:poly(hydroxyalkanoate) depolymerase family esterase [Bradyrhizobium sp. OAE829]